MSKEAEKLAEQLRDMVPGYRTPSHERGVLNDAIQTIRSQAEQIRELREVLQAAKNSLVAFKFMPSNPEAWEEHDEVNLQAVDAALSNTKEET